MAKKPDLQYVADLSARLLKAKADVKRLQAEWDALFQTGNGEQAPGEELTPKPETKVHRILTYLATNFNRSFTADELDDALSLGNKQSTATTLSKLVRRGAIQKVGNDRYASLGYLSVAPTELLIRQVS